MLNIYQITLSENASDSERVETLKARDVYDAHKLAYFKLANAQEDVQSIRTEDGVVVYSETEGFLEEQIF